MAYALFVGKAQFSETVYMETTGDKFRKDFGNFELHQDV